MLLTYVIARDVLTLIARSVPGFIGFCLLLVTAGLLLLVLPGMVAAGIYTQSTKAIAWSGLLAAPAAFWVAIYSGQPAWLGLVAVTGALVFAYGLLAVAINAARGRVPSAHGAVAR